MRVDTTVSQIKATGFLLYYVISCKLFFLVWAGLVSRIFSSKVFVRINKLTYAIYLLNPIVIQTTFGLFDTGSNVDPALYFLLIIGVSVITYVLAIVFSLLFEIPFYKLSNEILRGTKPTSMVKTTVTPKKEE